ncbi:MAG: hypothetical protein LWX56_10560 [Ignavibacteria bacterium]|nr:hypothetical protein [Ignavibacteria bacterium]
MRQLIVPVIFCFALMLYSCKESTNPVIPAAPVKIMFTLETHKQNDTGSTMVTFSGKLSGSYDTLKVTDPGAFIIGVDSAIAPYLASSKISAASNSYTVTQKVWAGSYKVFMLLKCANNLTIYSDTLLLTIIPNDTDLLSHSMALYDNYVLNMYKDSIASLFTADGQMISGSTVTAQTPAGIRNYLAAFDGVVQVLAQKTTITSITITNNSAIVLGSYTQKYKLLSNNQIGTASGTTRFEWTKTGGRWLISRAITN